MYDQGDSGGNARSGNGLKKIVPGICLLLLLGVACGGGFTVFVADLLKSSDAYVGALERARADARVVGALGVPVVEGFMPSGNISVSGGSGNADLAIGVSGPKGAGTLYVVATKSGGQWSYRTLALNVEGGSRIDLLLEEQVEED